MPFFFFGSITRYIQVIFLLNFLKFKFLNDTSKRNPDQFATTHTHIEV